MKKLVSLVVMVGALAQITNAMGPTGDITHRHFYKDQEWIWQSEQSQPKPGTNGNAITQPTSGGVSHVPVAFFVPRQPPVAFFVPWHPPVAFFVPRQPPVAFFVPRQPPVAFFVPRHPSVA